MGWGYGPPMWGFWPMFPLMGFAFVIVMVVVVFAHLKITERRVMFFISRMAGEGKLRIPEVRS
jgi:hypothetical protein